MGDTKIWEFKNYFSDDGGVGLSLRNFLNDNNIKEFKVLTYSKDYYEIIYKLPPSKEG